MSHTPPPLKVTAGPQPLARLKLKPHTIPKTSAVRLGALAFGRAIDASFRDDAEYFLGDRSEDAVRVARLLSLALAPRFEWLAKSFGGDDVVAIGIGLENLRHALSGQRALEGDAIDALFDIVASMLVEDEGLSRSAVSKVLSFAALEMYYHQGASASAKRRLDAMRNVVHLAAGQIEPSVDASQSILASMTVWEGWQALRGLALVFDVSDLARIMRVRGATLLADLLLGAGAILDAMRAEPTPAPIASPAATDESPLPVAWQKDLTSGGGDVPEGRHLRVILQDFEGQLERFRLLLDGDENSLVFEVAPILEASLKQLYREIEIAHPEVAAAVWRDPVAPASGDDVRSIRVLRAHLRSARDLFVRFRSLEEENRPIELTVPLAVAPPPDPLPDTLPNGPPMHAGDDPLRDIVLSASPVRFIRSEDQHLAFDLDLVFLDGPPRQGTLAFSDAASIRWKRLSLGGALGFIEGLERAGDRLRIWGPWGEVEVEGATLHVELAPQR
jgi:hypothetical protein